MYRAFPKLFNNNSSDPEPTRGFNGALEVFNETYDWMYQLMMFLIDDNALMFDDVNKMNIMDFFFHCSYKLDKNKLNTK